MISGSMKVFICPGKNKLEVFKDIEDEVDGLEIVGVMATKETVKGDWSPKKSGYKTWSKDDLIYLNKEFSQTKAHESYDYVLNSILHDHRAHYLIERVYTNGIFLDNNTIFNHSLKIEIAIWNSLCILNQVKPDRIFIPSTPHTEIWFFVKTAELIGIDVFHLPYSSLRWKSLVVRGVEEHIPQDIDPEYCSISRENVENFVNKIRSTYDEAIPDYEKEPLERFGGKEGGIIGEIKTIFSSPSTREKLSKVKSALQKRSALKLYNRLTDNFQLPDKYVVFFLHFQPERTTLPEAKNYVQQWFAIRALSASLPDDTKLLVKEHPSMFRNHFSKKVRDQQFYKSVNTLENASFVPLQVTPFELIDSSLAVATCTGTVGVEALVRGKPVLVFGIAQYKDADGVYEIGSVKDVKNSLEHISNKFKPMSDKKLYEYLERVDQMSIARTDDNYELIRQAMTVNPNLKLQEYE